MLQWYDELTKKEGYFGTDRGPHMLHSHTVHLPLGALLTMLLTPCTMCGAGTDQFKNQTNPAAHYASTGPELWLQTGGEVDTPATHTVHCPHRAPPFPRCTAHSVHRVWHRWTSSSTASAPAAPSPGRASTSRRRSRRCRCVMRILRMSSSSSPSPPVALGWECDTVG